MFYQLEENNPYIEILKKNLLNRYMILNRCTKKPFNVTNSYLKFFIGFMWDLETVDAIQKLQRHLCDFVGMVISVSFRKSAHYHVSIANCFYLSQNETKFTVEIVRIFTEVCRLVSVFVNLVFTLYTS